MELLALQVDGLHLIVCDLDFGGIGLGVEAGVDVETGLGLVAEIRSMTSFVLSGRVIVSQGESPDALAAREFGPGDTWRSSPRVVHTLEAVEDAEIIEVSTPQLDDVVRLEDRYGRVGDAAP